MLKLNKEYTYKEICSVLHWKESTGDQKKKQIKEIETSYVFFHPENKKTHKHKKTYVFTEQIKLPELTDGRKSNGAVNLFPDDDFEYLMKCIFAAGLEINCYHCRGMVYEMYMTSALIYKEFGFDVYSAFRKMVYGEGHTEVVYLFEKICIDAVKANTITRICKKFGMRKNSLPKGILIREGHDTVPDNSLLPIYEKYMREYLKEYGCKSEMEAVKKNVYYEITKKIEQRFEEEHKKHEVKRFNLITVPVEEIKEFSPDKNKKVELQRKFCIVVVESIVKSVLSRCNESKVYRQTLNSTEKRVLKNYLHQMLVYFGLENDFSIPVERETTEKIEDDSTDWLNDIV